MSVNLGAPQVADNQDQKERTINDAVGAHDAALTGNVDFSGDGDFTMAAEDYNTSFFIILSAGSAMAGYTVTVPDNPRGLFTVNNDSGQDATITIDAQSLTPPTIADGATALLMSDGINVRLVATLP